MTVTQQVYEQGKKVKINICGRFDFESSQEFRAAYLNLDEHKGVCFHVDLSQAHYMDSSALGMLLLLREYAKSKGGSVIIEKPGVKINKILKVANFEHLFTIN